MGMLTGCGTPGIPLPPSLELPKPVSDLHAFRKGNKVYLNWTAPARTTDSQPIRHIGSTRICRNDVSQKECAAIAEASPASRPGSASPKANGAPPPAVLGSYVDNIPMQPVSNAFGNFIYAVEVLNDRGRSAGLSNQSKVPAAPTLPPPTNFAAEVTEGGVVLTWAPIPPKDWIAGLHYLYRIYRRERGSKPDTALGEIPLETSQTGVVDHSFVDHTFEWEKRYSYHATGVTIVDRKGETEAQVEGEDTPPVTVFAHDIFPPSVPSGLQAVFASEDKKSFVDLVWNPDTDADLAGYIVYRREAGGTIAKINSELVKTPAFRDQSVSSGKTYFYSVSGVDVRGNESARSREASESIP